MSRASDNAFSGTATQVDMI